MHTTHDRRIKLSSPQGCSSEMKRIKRGRAGCIKHKTRPPKVKDGGYAICDDAQRVSQGKCRSGTCGIGVGKGKVFDKR